HGRLLVALVVLGVALSLVSVSVTALTVDVLFLREERSSTTWCSTRDGVREYGTIRSTTWERPSGEGPPPAPSAESGANITFGCIRVLATQPTCHGGQSRC